MDTRRKITQKREPAARKEAVKQRPAQIQSRRKPASPQGKNDAREAEVKTTPDVVYLAPKPFSRSRLLLRLATVAAVVLALVLGVSVFFKVENITVSGTLKYSVWDIRAASGIEVGENLLTFSRAKASGKIIAALPYVESVRIGIKLPDTVMIDIEEVDVTYGAQATDDSWWMLSAEGKVIGKSEPTGTKILGIRLVNPVEGQTAHAAEIPPQTDPDGQQIPVTVTTAQRLQTALDIAQYLEHNGIIGKAASIDVSVPGDLVVWYGQQYQVKLGDSTQLGYKISCMKNVIDNMASYAGGVVDITDPEHMQYQPF